MDIMQILTIILGILVFTIIILASIYIYLSVKNKSKIKKENKVEINNIPVKEKAKTQTSSQYTKLSIFDFMEFDKIEDNMIVQNNAAKYLMVIECEGINYDLMSEVEKTSVESGFIQFLNILRHPIQIYTQTRTVNIGNSIESYNKKVDEVNLELIQKQNIYNKTIQSRQYDQKELENLKLEIARLKNLYDYGKDIIANIEKMSLNKNVLKKYYYIVVPYHTSELGNDITDEEEKRNMVFSELYTRSEAIIRTLFACSMKCRVMDSNDLAELLYVAYNRDESEVYSVEKALKAGYNELYVTAPDVLDKRMEALNKEINDKALVLAKEMIDEVRNEKQKSIKKKEDSFDDIVKEIAESLLKENKEYIGEDIANEAIKKVKKKSTKEEVSKNEKR